jgi:hypothetical protein
MDGGMAKYPAHKCSMHFGGRHRTLDAEEGAEVPTVLLFSVWEPDGRLGVALDTDEVPPALRVEIGCGWRRESYVAVGAKWMGQAPRQLDAAMFWRCGGAAIRCAPMQI